MTPVKSSPVVLITGASSGIGLAAAQRLHARGARVWGASRRMVAGEIPWLAMDVTDDDAVAAGVAAVMEKEGRIDALITCAGYGIAGAIEDTSTAEAQAQFATNFFGTFSVVRAVLPAMRAQGGGRIVMVGSIAGRIALPFQGFYCASKFALEGFAESLRMEVKPFGIGVSLIEPGDFKTDFTAARVRVAGANATSPYYAVYERALKQMEEEERCGPAAAIVADRILALLDGKRPPLRVRVGRFVQKFAVSLKAVLPEAIFEKLIMGSYKIG
jgi:NAD(P)-dependent dehydrogenase (short-subunit alcohol dehydrogenase family)